MITFDNEKDMINFGERLSRLMFGGFILTLDGDLGAGKTTFTKGIGRGLGIKKVINSPTFTIVKVYHGDKTLYHFDAYRLEGENDELGFEEMFEDDGVCVVEWPEFIEDILPPLKFKDFAISAQVSPRLLSLSNLTTARYWSALLNRAVYSSSNSVFNVASLPKNNSSIFCTRLNVGDRRL